MKLHSIFRRVPFQIVVFGLFAFVLLTIRFSPNWVAFNYGVRDAKDNVTNAAQGAAIDKAILSGYSARGFYVTEQTHDLNAEIDDTNHKIVRWRLLVPVLGHFLKLPNWLTLGLAHLGCIALILTFVGIGLARAETSNRPSYESIGLGVIAGASAPFFTSMGLLGYYDSWLALALIGVAFARQRWVVLLACLLAPWLDERFVIGLPLALAVRRIISDNKSESRWVWFKRQALIPIIVVSGYSVIRLTLGGSGGSQTVGQYLNQFVFAERLSASQRFTGAWEGLRFGWFLVAAAMLGTWRARETGNRVEAFLLGAGVAITSLIGLFTALDLSRSMVLIIPVVTLGLIFALRTVWWSKFYVTPVLAASALLLPASHVVGKLSCSVDNLWSTNVPLADAQNGLGTIYEHGDGVPKDSTEAIRWYRKAAEEHGSVTARYNLGLMYLAGEGVSRDDVVAAKLIHSAAEQGLAVAQNNLGAMYSRGEGVPRDISEAANWYRKAANQGLAAAQQNLGALYDTGDGVPKDVSEASRWYRKAADQGLAVAQNNLGLMYAEGDGVPKDSSEAVKWFRMAAEQGNASAQNSLGTMYFNGHGVPKDFVQAHWWFSLASTKNNEGAKRNLIIVEKEMTLDQIAEAKSKAQELLNKRAP